MAIILYIEDNYQNLRLVRKMLEVGGHNMIEAVNGMNGLSMAAEQVPDLILVDINLPDIDGVEVTRQLKLNPNLSHIPVVALTANAMYGQKELYLEAGCDGYIAKPVSKKELLSTVEHFLGG